MMGELEVVEDALVQSSRYAMVRLLDSIVEGFSGGFGVQNQPISNRA